VVLNDGMFTRVRLGVWQGSLRGGAVVGSAAVGSKARRGRLSAEDPGTLLYEDDVQIVVARRLR
jgi:hypothetical protein